MKQPTDIQVLAALYRAARDAEDAEEGRHPTSSPEVPVDPETVATALGVTERVLFGHILYHLNQVYQSKHGGNGPLVTFTGTPWSVSLPRVAALYANLRAEQRRQSWTQGIAFAALAVSVLSLGLSIWKPSDPVRVEVVQALPQKPAPENLTAPPKAPLQPPAKP